MGPSYEKEHIRMLSAIVKNLELMNVNLADIKSLILRQNEIMENEDDYDDEDIIEIGKFEEEDDE